MARKTAVTARTLSATQRPGVRRFRYIMRFSVHNKVSTLDLNGNRVEGVVIAIMVTQIESVMYQVRWTDQKTGRFVSEWYNEHCLEIAT